MKFKNKLLIIPDIHLKHIRADKIIKKYQNTHKIILYGDYYDDFNDTPKMNGETAKWLKESLTEPNRIHLIGNHDLNYDPRSNTMCSGFSHDKKRVINSILSIDDWDKLKYFHFENGWLFSHAGINQYWFADPKTGLITEEYMQKVIDDAVTKTRMGDYNNAIWASDSSRGGNSRYGGILWQDWRRCEFIPNFKQIVGHSPISRVQQISDNIVNSHLINVDSSLKTPLMEVLEIDENGKPNVIQLPEII